ncbi:MAG: hypothetical protein ACI83D_000117 [Planctomycetota bacterium]|jgi:hypothetical protein
MQGGQNLQFIDIGVIATKIVNFFRGSGDGSLFDGEGLIGFFTSPTVRITGAIVLLIALTGIIYLLIRIQEFQKDDRRRFKEYFVTPSVQQRKNERWEKITALFASENPNDWRVAIIEADAMLDELFTRLGYPGETLGEKMKGATSRDFPSIQRAWDAHLVRNKIAHEGMNFSMDHNQVIRVLHLYESVFKEARFI